MKTRLLSLMVLRDSNSYRTFPDKLMATLLLGVSGWFSLPFSPLLLGTRWDSAS